MLAGDANILMTQEQYVPQTGRNGSAICTIDCRKIQVCLEMKKLLFI